MNIVSFRYNKFKTSQGMCQLLSEEQVEHNIHTISVFTRWEQGWSVLGSVQLSPPSSDTVPPHCFPGPVRVWNSMRDTPHHTYHMLGSQNPIRHMCMWHEVLLLKGTQCVNSQPILKAAQTEWGHHRQWGASSSECVCSLIKAVAGL